jgi:CHASE3 domain sensor protein
MATNLKEDKVMMGFCIAFIIIVLIVLYSLARTAGESDRILESIREQSLLGREESSGGNS